MLKYFNNKKARKPVAEKPEKEHEGRDLAEAKVNENTPSTTIIVSRPEDKPEDRSQEKAQEESEGTPILDHEDEKFLERLTSPNGTITIDDDDETPPPLPPRVKTPVIDWDSDSTSASSKKHKKDKSKEKSKGKGKAGETKDAKSDPDHKSKRFSFVTNLSRNISKRRKPKDTGLKPELAAVPGREALKEEEEMARVLDDLQLSASENKAFSLSKETSEMVKNFTQVLKDLANGVPTAYGDLVRLIDDRDGVLERTYEKLPKSLKKLVAQLPEQLSSKLAPELLAVAAEAQGLSAEEGAAAGLGGAAKQFFNPKNLHDLITKPGAVAGMLKGIVNALKVRWPAFMGTNVLWSVAVFLLLSVLWYCHKRGREVRLEQEAADNPIDGSDRIEELPDDPLLPAPAPSAGADKDVSSPVVDKGKGKEVAGPAEVTPAGESSEAAAASAAK